MRVYVDSSALLKRVFAESESEALKASLRSHVAQGEALVSSSLAWLEVARALRAGTSGADIDDLSDRALSGILERPIGDDSCRLTVTHDQLREGANDELYGGWPMILSGLKTWIETGEVLTTPGSLMYG